LLSDADASLTSFESLENELSGITERMLSGVGVKFGYDSIEYEKAGGTRKGDIKQSLCKAQESTKQ
jgi:hypothetical protein